MRRYGASILLLSLMLLPGSAPGASLVDDALASFPPQTVRVEYSSPTKLRALPNYAKLRERYLGPRLAKLESSLSDLGVVETDVDELVLGWRSAAESMDLYGFAKGRFNSSVIAERAKARNLEPETIAGRTAYCLEAGLAASCIVLLDKSVGAFGTLGTLTALLDARAGAAPALRSNARFTNLLKLARTETSIWGVALGPAATDWFKSWMPGQKNVQLDWSRVFQGVEALVYSVDASDKVQLSLKLDCASPEIATSLRQMLEGLKLAQQLAWQAQNPNQPNPFEGIDVDLSDRQVGLKLTTAYAALDGPAPGGTGTP